MKLNKKHRLWIVIGVATVVLGTVVTLFLFSGGEKTAPPKKIKPAFLEVESPWVDSLMNELTIEQKIAQIIFVKSSVDQKDSIQLLGNWGAFHLYGRWSPGSITDSIVKGVPPLLAASQKFALWRGEKSMPEEAYFKAVPDTLMEEMIYLEYLLGRSMKTSAEVFSVDSIRRSERPSDLYLSHPHRPQLFAWAETAGRLRNDTRKVQDSLLKPLKELGPMGLPGVIVKADDISADFGKKDLDLSEFLADECDFRGITAVDLDRETSTETIERSLRSGGDVLITTDPVKTFEGMQRMLDLGVISKEQLDSKVRRVLQAKAWVGLDSTLADTMPEIDEWYYEEWIDRVKQSSVAVLSNSSHIPGRRSTVPIRDPWAAQDRLMLLRKGETNLRWLYRELEQFAPTGLRVMSNSNTGSLSGVTHVVFCNAGDTLTEQDSALLEKLKEVDQGYHLTIVLTGPPSQLDLFDGFDNVIYSIGLSEIEQEQIGEIITGGDVSTGKLYTSTNSFDLGTSLQTVDIRLTDTRAFEVNMSPDSLRNIQWIAEEGIRMGAYPGCQVLVARKGKIVYNRSFGYLTYAKKIPVTNDHLFDLASVTKITGTTLTAMKLSELGVFGLDDSLKDYISDTLRQHLPMGRPSTLSNVTWRDLLIHKSGLPAGYPVIEFMEYQDSVTGRYDRFFCDRKDDSLFNIQIAQNMYLDSSYLDSVWVRINSMWLDPNKAYKYSDVNFNTLYTLMKGEIEKRPAWIKKDPYLDTGLFNAYEKFLRDSFLIPLGMDQTCFLPLRYFPKNRIAPTEDDRFWRKQLIHGYVHDPTAALYGGIAGNAGLFSSASSVAKLYQMWVNKGTYGGKRYLNPSTVTHFTSRQPGSHRGLGFNKPVGGGMYGIAEKASLSTYGHTGWTGNSVWIDPENELVFIFLSNRSHPVSDNPKILRLGTRKRIQQAVYSALLDKDVMATFGR